MAGLLFWKQKYLVVRFEGVRKGFLSERMGGGGGGGGGAFHVEGPKFEK